MNKKYNQRPLSEEPLGMIQIGGLQVDDCGYRWVTGWLEGDSREHRFLVSMAFENGLLTSTHNVRPDENLFQKLGETELSEDAFLEIANSYGSLGLLGSDFRYGDSAVGHGESFTHWTEKVSEFQQSFRLWEAIESGDQRELKRQLAGYRPLFPLDLALSAKAELVDPINRNLRGLQGQGVSYGVKLNIATGILASRVLADRPLATVWLHLAEIVCGSKKIVRCEVCHKFMDVTNEPRPKAHRGHKNCRKARSMRKLRAKRA